MILFCEMQISNSLWSWIFFFGMQISNSLWSVTSKEILPWDLSKVFFFFLIIKKKELDLSKLVVKKATPIWWSSSISTTCHWSWEHKCDHPLSTKKIKDHSFKSHWTRFIFSVCLVFDYKLVFYLFYVLFVDFTLLFIFTLF